MVRRLEVEVLVAQQSPAVRVRVDALKDLVDQRLVVHEPIEARAGRATNGSVGMPYLSA